MGSPDNRRVLRLTGRPHDDGLHTRGHDHRAARWHELFDPACRTRNEPCILSGIHPQFVDQPPLETFVTPSFRVVGDFSASGPLRRLPGICRLAPRTRSPSRPAFTADTGEIGPWKTPGRRSPDHHGMRAFNRGTAMTQNDRPSVRYGTVPVDGPARRDIMSRGGNDGGLLPAHVIRSNDGNSTPQPWKEGLEAYAPMPGSESGFLRGFPRGGGRGSGTARPHAAEPTVPTAGKAGESGQRQDKVRPRPRRGTLAPSSPAPDGRFLEMARSPRRPAGMGRSGGFSRADRGKRKINLRGSSPAKTGKGRGSSWNTDPPQGIVLPQCARQGSGTFRQRRDPLRGFTFATGILVVKPKSRSRHGQVRGFAEVERSCRPGTGVLRVPPSRRSLEPCSCRFPLLRMEPDNRGGSRCSCRQPCFTGTWHLAGFPFSAPRGRDHRTNPSTKRSS